jgi:transposase
MSERPVAGIDVSKRFSDLCILAPDNTVICETKIYHDLTSMNKAVEKLQAVKDTYDESPVIIMESTAHYHRILYYFLMNTGFEVILINPLQSGAVKNMGIRKIKSDRTDAKRLALLYRLKFLHSSKIDHSITNSLKDLARQRTDLVSERVKYINKLVALLDQAFPGYCKVFSQVRGKSSLAVLMRFPTPQAILKARKDTLRKVIGEACGRGTDSRFAHKKAEELKAAATEAQQICISRTSFEILITMTVAMLWTIQDSAERLKNEIMSLAASDPSIKNNVQLLTSIPGIGEYSAVVILSEIGDISLFSNPKQLVAFCGLDPSVRQSGTFLGSRNRISKRGSSYLRLVLTLCTHVAVHPGKNQIPANAVLCNYFLKKCESKPPKVALCACMHKMVNIIFAVLRDQKSFELRMPEEHIRLMKASKFAGQAA